MAINKFLYGLIILFLFFCENSFAQEENNGIVIKPTVGIGAGMLTYYGDISKNQQENSSIVSRVAYDFRVTQKLNSYLDLNFYFLFGKVGANEKSLTRNLNFESKISSGGFNLSYNFSHLLKEDRIVEPYLSAGVESFEFLSKTDRIDANGTTYNYWDDGSIRNLPQDSKNAENAVRLQRDFKYESDIRTLNLDSFGKYPERSFAFPVGAGINFLLWDRCSFRIGTSMHFTMTDLIDGVTDKSLGDRAGDSKKDKFLYSSFSLTYNLSTKNEEDGIPEEDLSDLIALFNADSDGDGVKDTADKCPNTPAGSVVDANGCSSEQTVSLDTSEEFLEAQYKKYLSADGSETFDTIIRKHTGEKPTSTVSTRYYVQLGEFSGDIPDSLANMILSIPDAQTWLEGNRTVITVGDYEKLPDAVKRALQLQQEGIKDASVVTTDKSGNLQKVDSKGVDVKAGTINDQPGQMVYRVQVGAFSKKLSKNIFEEITDLVSVPGEDGLTRYYSGAFPDYKSTAKRKIDLIADGFEGAFVVAFKDGKRILLKGEGPAAGGGTSAEKAEAAKENKKGSVKKDYIKFRVQVGAYKKDVPSDMLAKFAELGDVEQKNTPEGVTLYTSGKFSDFESAKNHQMKLMQKGISAAFVIGEFKGKILTAQEAIELLKK